MPSLIYAPVWTFPKQTCAFFCWQVVHVLTMVMLSGVSLARGGDERVHAAHRASSVYLEAQALQLHLGEPADSKIAIWHEGWRWDLRLRAAMLTGPRLHSSSS